MICLSFVLVIFRVMNKTVSQSNPDREGVQPWTKTNAPIETLLDGRLKATIWENLNEKGEAYPTVALAKTYEHRNGKLQDTVSFSGSELLRVAELAREAHGVIRDMRREHAIERRSEQQNTRSASSHAQLPGEGGGTPARFRGRAQQSSPGMER